MVITERKHDSLPKKINLNCSNCNTNNLDFQTLTINPKTKAHTIIKFNLIWLGISLLFNLGILIISVFNLEEMINYLFDSNNFFKETTDTTRAIVILTLQTKYQIVLSGINIILKLLSFNIKKDAVITICKECGTVVSYYNQDYEEGE